MDGHIAKPFQPMLLLESMRQVLQQAARAEDQSLKDTVVDGTPVLRASDLLQRVGGDRKLLRELINMFLEDAPVLLGDIRQHIDSHDGPRLRLAAHALNGALGNFGAAAAQRAALALETMGRAALFWAAGDAYAILVKEIERLRGALRHLLQTLPRSAANGTSPVLPPNAAL
jgi:HPt (histidine-containing phosphotransfer) domain-containing protein